MAILSYGTFHGEGIIEKNGHFELNSGRHSAEYIVKERVWKNPFLADDIVHMLAEQFAKPCNPDFIVGPETGGAKLADRVAKEAGLPWAKLPKDIAEDDRAAFVDELRDRLEGQAVVLVDDVLTTGGTLKKCVALLREAGAVVVAVLVIVKRGVESINFDNSIRFACLAAFEIADYPADDCPLCDRGIALMEKPRV